MCYIWKNIMHQVYYFIEPAHWTLDKLNATQYTDCEKAIRTAQLLNANVGRIGNVHHRET